MKKIGVQFLQTFSYAFLSVIFVTALNGCGNENVSSSDWGSLMRTDTKNVPDMSKNLEQSPQAGINCENAASTVATDANGDEICEPSTEVEASF